MPKGNRARGTGILGLGGPPCVLWVASYWGSPQLVIQVARGTSHGVAWLAAALRLLPFTNGWCYTAAPCPSWFATGNPFRRCPLSPTPFPSVLLCAFQPSCRTAPTTIVRAGARRTTLCKHLQTSNFHQRRPQPQARAAHGTVHPPPAPSYSLQNETCETLHYTQTP